MGSFYATFRGVNVKTYRRTYKKESTAFRYIYKFLCENESDPTSVVTLISPGNPVRTFIDSDEVQPNVIENKDFYSSKQWRVLRFKVLAEYGPRCMCCGRTAEDNVTIEVDHIYPRSKYPSLKLEFYNFQVLCGICNEGKLNIVTIDFRPDEVKHILNTIVAKHKREGLLNL